VLEVVYLIFNEGYAATSGDDLFRPSLCLEAQRLGRMLAALMPEDAEVFGLLALMEIQASRLPARIGPDGALVPLTEQNRASWDHLLIRRGLTALARAETLGGGEGPYALQAALAACHARARGPSDTNWPHIAALYDRLRAVMASPVVDLNRAVAYSMAFGPEAGLRLVKEIPASALPNYAPLPAARGDFLFRCGRLSEARAEFEAAANLTRNAGEAAFLRARADACDAWAYTHHNASPPTSKPTN
jgi:predicted RNA polymerase sigma factor